MLSRSTSICHLCSSGGGITRSFCIPRSNNLVEAFAVSGIARRPAEIAPEARVRRPRGSREVLHGLLARKPSRQPDGNAARAQARPTARQIPPGNVRTGTSSLSTMCHTPLRAVFPRGDKRARGVIGVDHRPVRVSAADNGQLRASAMHRRAFACAPNRNRKTSRRAGSTR